MSIQVLSSNHLILKLLLSILGLSLILPSRAETLSQADRQLLNTHLFRSLTDENFVKHSRLTKRDVHSACEAEFQYAYRDIREKRGAPILLTGSFSARLEPGKHLGYMLKINAHEPSFDNKSWSTLAPAYINATVNKKSFKPYKITEFICESGGRCAGYLDQSLELNTAVVKETPFDLTISWSLSEGGTDTTVKLSEIGKNIQTQQSLRSFYMCHMELIEKFIKQ